MLGQDILYSREIIKRIEELEGERDEYTEDDEFTIEQWLDDMPEDAKELAALKEFENAGVADWLHGETFILESYFTTYARQIAEDCEDIPDHWPFTTIDWDTAAKVLRPDYTEVEAGGYTYYVRT